MPRDTQVAMEKLYEAAIASGLSDDDATNVTAAFLKRYGVDLAR